MPELEGVLIIAEFEGYPIEEAKLTYAARQKLSKGVFCGPDRTYPAHDAKHVRNGFTRLSTFGKKLSRSIALRIYRCLVKRAKKYSIEHDPKKFGWLLGKKKIEETFHEFDVETQELIAFALEGIEQDN